MVPDRDDLNKESPFLISYPPRYDARSAFSRATPGVLGFDLTNQRIVYLKDYWRPNVPNMPKEGEIYRVLVEKKVRNIAPFGMGNDVRGHQTLTQFYVDAPWAVSTKKIICLVHYRMTLDVVGRPLVEFDSSHQFISAIADAMEAHDDACFEARILHRDISVGNILITKDNKGMLIDWDLCADMDTVTARRPSRTFMSAQLLMSPNSVHQIEDDRESAFHVLLWVAMGYSRSHVLDQTPSSANPSSSSTQDTLQTDMRALIRQFDEAYIDDRETVKGGKLKRDLFTSTDVSKLKFNGRPQLDALLVELAKAFAVRYGPQPEPDDLKALAIQETAIARNRDPELLDEMIFARNRTTAYKFQKLKDQLEKERHWLVNTIRSHLNTGTWPEDKAELQKIFQITSKRKDRRASLETRPSSKNR